MKQLNKLQTIVLLSGAVLMVAGAGLYVFGTMLMASWIFLVGALCFASMQMMQTYSGNNFTIRRLRRIMITGDVLFILSALLMVENSYGLLLPCFSSFRPTDTSITSLMFTTIGCSCSSLLPCLRFIQLTEYQASWLKRQKNSKSQCIYFKLHEKFFLHR